MRRSLARLLPSILLISACATNSGDAAAPEPSPDPLAPIPELPASAAKLEIPVLGLELGLPEQPDFVLANLPAVAEDGTWSIRGLRSVRDELLPEGELGKVVLVSAYVQEVYAAPPCPKDSLCPPGKLPHAWFVDDPRIEGKQDALMVPGIEFPIPEWDEAAQEFWASSRAVEFEVGRRYVLMGWFRRFSDSGFAHDKGLLELLAVTDYPATADSVWLVPPNSYHHPRVRADSGLPPLAPERATVPTCVLHGTNYANLGPLIEPSDNKQAVALAQEAIDAGDPRRADYYLRWMIVADPDASHGWIGIADFYVDYGQYDLGLAVIDLAIARRPDDASLHNGRGRALLNIGHFELAELAVSAYQRAHELTPDAPDVLFGLGIAYAETAQRELAIETLARFLEVAQDAPDHIRQAAMDTMMRMEPAF